jgi:hypothetical protein
MLKRIILLTLVLTALLSCKKDEPETGTLKINFLVEGSDGLAELPFLSEDINGVPMRIELLKIYFAKIAVKNSEGSASTLSDIELLDYSGANRSRSFTINSGSYASLDFILGIDEVQNASDPVSFDDTHPLSAAQNMYWTWASKYIFFKIEGRADTTFENLFNHLFIYHVGTDDLSRPISNMPASFVIEGGKTTEINLVLDLNAALSDPSQGVDVATESLTHTLDNVPLAARIADVMSKAFRVE